METPGLQVIGCCIAGGAARCARASVLFSRRSAGQHGVVTHSGIAHEVLLGVYSSPDVSPLGVDSREQLKGVGNTVDTCASCVCRTGYAEVRRGRRLVVSFIMTAVNYEYCFYWYLYQVSGANSLQCSVCEAHCMLAASHLRWEVTLKDHWGPATIPTQPQSCGPQTISLGLYSVWLVAYTNAMMVLCHAGWRYWL